jgi:hypothetical protein
VWRPFASTMSRSPSPSRSPRLTFAESSRRSLESDDCVKLAELLPATAHHRQAGRDTREERGMTGLSGCQTMPFAKHYQPRRTATEHQPHGAPVTHSDSRVGVNYGYAMTAAPPPAAAIAAAFVHEQHEADAARHRRDEQPRRIRASRVKNPTQPRQHYRTHRGLHAPPAPCAMTWRIFCRQTMRTLSGGDARPARPAAAGIRRYVELPSVERGYRPCVAMQRVSAMPSIMRAGHPQRRRGTVSIDPSSVDCPLCREVVHRCGHEKSSPPNATAENARMQTSCSPSMSAHYRG